MRSHARKALFVESRTSGSTTVLTLTGSLADDTLSILGQALSKELAKIPPFLVLDVRGLHTLDPLAHGLLTSAAAHARSSGGRLMVVGPALGADLDTAPTVEAALAAMRRGW